MRADHRSGCPINLTLEILGDKWSLLIIRDIIFGDRRHFRELLQKSEEGIASNILAVRLKRLIEQGIITRASDPTHKQKGIYSLTEQGIELLPVLAQMAGWGRKYLPATDALGINGKILEQGGSKMWVKFMSDLRDLHLGTASRRRTRAGSAMAAAKQKPRRRAVGSLAAKAALGKRRSKRGG